MEKKFRRAHNYTKELPPENKKLREARLSSTWSAPYVESITYIPASTIYRLETGKTHKPLISKRLQRAYNEASPLPDTSEPRSKLRAIQHMLF